MMIKVFIIIKLNCGLFLIGHFWTSKPSHENCLPNNAYVWLIMRYKKVLLKESVEYSSR